MYLGKQIQHEVRKPKKQQTSQVLWELSEVLTVATQSQCCGLIRSNTAMAQHID